MSTKIVLICLILLPLIVSFARAEGDSDSGESIWEESENDLSGAPEMEYFWFKT